MERLMVIGVVAMLLGLIVIAGDRTAVGFLLGVAIFAAGSYLVF